MWNWKLDKAPTVFARKDARNPVRYRECSGRHAPNHHVTVDMYRTTTLEPAKSREKREVKFTESSKGKHTVAIEKSDCLFLLREKMVANEYESSI